MHYRGGYPFRALDFLQASTSLRDVWIDAYILPDTLNTYMKSVLALLQDPPVMRILHCLCIPADAGHVQKDVCALMKGRRYPKVVVDKIVFEEYPEK